VPLLSRVIGSSSEPWPMGRGDTPPGPPTYSKGRAPFGAAGQIEVRRGPAGRPVWVRRRPGWDTIVVVRRSTMTWASTPEPFMSSCAPTPAGDCRRSCSK